MSKDEITHKRVGCDQKEVHRARQFVSRRSADRCDPCRIRAAERENGACVRHKINCMQLEVSAIRDGHALVAIEHILTEPSRRKKAWIEEKWRCYVGWCPAGLRCTARLTRARQSGAARSRRKRATDLNPRRHYSQF